MKIGALIGFIIAALGAFLRTFAYFQVTTVDLWLDFRNASSVIETPVPLVIVGHAVFIFGMLLVFSSGFVKSTAMMVIGNIFFIITFLMELSFWFFNLMYGGTLIIFNGVYTLSALIYMLGCISFRKHNVITVITGILLFLLIVGVQGVIGIGLMAQFFDDNGFVSMYFVAQSVLTIFWAFHALLFSFSKKELGWSHEDEEDSLSVESGAAFASYVPYETGPRTEGKSKKKKKKKKDDFTFDF
ncbi:MAG: hypothetical protein K9W44_07915 [Candidatus Lokiarchaeota archaeon]|nr:hypothetical protein [Candidatus Harpocratesius repetitus]